MLLALPTETTVTIPGIADLIDQFGEVSALRDEFAPTERLYQKLRGQLKDLTEDAEPTDTFTLQGNRFYVEISERKFESTPNVLVVRRKLGAITFLKIVSVTKKALEAFMVKPEIEKLCVSTQTGSRTFEAKPL